MMRVGRHNVNRPRQQSGLVLLTVLLLVIMFTGLGLLAMRHTTGELRSTGAYLDSTQAAAVAEAAISMVATDVRLNWDHPPGVAGGGCDTYLNYRAQLNQNLGNSGSDAGVGTDNENIRLNFSPTFDVNCASAAGKLPDSRMSNGAPLAQTAALGNAFADVTVFHRQPILAPATARAGYTHSSDDNLTFDWYFFEVTSKAEYGALQSVSTRAKGEAIARSRMVIGPLLAF